jgi:hypothetical protein
MAENKTVPTDQKVEDFLNTVEDERQRKDSFVILEFMKEITGMEPQMWGSSIVGFGSYRYKGASGRTGDWMLTGFSPRKQNLTLYGMGGFERHHDLLQQLGKHSLGKGCLYIKRLDNVDVPALKRVMEAVFKYAEEHKESQNQ